MKFVVNALSVDNPSGRHVLLGHLEQVVAAADGHEFVVLHHDGNSDLQRDLGPSTRWARCPSVTRHWLGRRLWERGMLPRSPLLHGADWLVSPSGTVVPGLPLRQLAFCQNPWALVGGIHRGPGERVKAALQRRAYRQAVREADLMVFNSEYMRDAYRANAGTRERRSFVAYQALDPSTWDAAERLGGLDRIPLQLLAVSVMAPHKGVEVLVRALRILRETHGIPARLDLVGSWPDAGYDAEVRGEVAALGLGDAIRFRGYVSRAELDEAYATASVFCLLSRCESFGIPAVEAQAFGTPVVTSDACAVPEVCGEGAAFCDPADPKAAADAIRVLLTDGAAWDAASRAARANAERYRWEACSRPFVEALRACEVSGAAVAPSGKNAA